MSQAFKRPQDGKENLMFYALEKPWMQVIPGLLRRRGLLAPGKQAEEVWQQWIAPFIARSPIPIHSVFDCFWWVTYACKFQHDLLRVHYNVAQITAERRHSVENCMQHVS